MLTGLVLSSSGISLNTQPAVKINILWYVNFGVVQLWVVKWGVMMKKILKSAQHSSSHFSKHMTFGAFTTLEDGLFLMSTIRIEKNHFLMLKFACCANSLKLCPLVVEKFLFERKLVTLLSWILLGILKVVIISLLIRRYANVGRLSAARCSG